MHFLKHLKNQIIAILFSPLLFHIKIYYNFFDIHFSCCVFGPHFFYPFLLFITCWGWLSQKCPILSRFSLILKCNVFYYYYFLCVIFVWTKERYPFFCVFQIAFKHFRKTFWLLSALFSGDRDCKKNFLRLFQKKFIHFCFITDKGLIFLCVFKNVFNRLFRSEINHSKQEWEREWARAMGKKKRLILFAGALPIWDGGGGGGPTGPEGWCKFP